MRPGARIGIDVGSVRIGVALSDRDGLLATPVETVPFGDGDIARLIELAKELDAMEFVVGLPKSLSGANGPAAELAIAFAHSLAQATELEVRLVDERLSTTQATKSLRQAGRNAKQSRSVIDQQAAVVILQSALDMERASGQAPGECVRLES
ncbi:MAG: Holliday junction resolvase RuvX [Actinobacteria bacterium]|nr:Holliday junction resolvase RuvX [Actinomycetota bacterium]